MPSKRAFFLKKLVDKIAKTCFIAIIQKVQVLNYLKKKK